MPHTIAENLQRLQTARNSIAAAIIAKGGAVSAGDGLDDFASDITEIPDGAIIGNIDCIGFIDNIRNGFAAMYNGIIVASWGINVGVGSNTEFVLSGFDIQSGSTLELLLGQIALAGYDGTVIKQGNVSFDNGNIKIKVTTNVPSDRQISVTILILPPT